MSGYGFAGGSSGYDDEDASVLLHVKVVRNEYH
jgi:hypothetical protein